MAVQQRELRQHSVAGEESSSSAVKPQSFLHKPFATSAEAAPSAAMPQGLLHKPFIAGAESASSIGEKRTRPLDWAEWLQQETVAKRQRLGKQKRKLVMHTMFSGLCSPEKSLRELGVECDNAVAAEWKPHARRFCYQNGLAPSGHFFTDAQPLPSTGTGPCCAHGAVCSLPV